MKILVISDTHGKIENFKEAFNREKPDKIYHLGDGEGFLEQTERMLQIPVEIVAGNCDWGYDLPRSVVLEVGNHVLLLTHGHAYGVRTGYGTIIEAAGQKGCDTILYGHTHVPVIDYVSTQYGPMTIANPGSLSYPRQPSKEHTYMVIDVDKAGELHMSLRSVEQLLR